MQCEGLDPCSVRQDVGQSAGLVDGITPDR